jgi:crotonobetainyl-CoA hydratase
VEAHRLGLVSEVAPHAELLLAARRWAAQILACAPLSVRASKQAAIAGLDVAGLEAAMSGRYEQVGLMLGSEDLMEGARAFAQKRRPAWKGR